MLTLETAKVEHISVLEIEPGERYRDDLGDIKELKDSIEKIGLIHPIVVCKTKETNFYRLLAGGRRLRAFVELQYPQIKATVLEVAPTELELRVIELVENTHRKDLSYVEETLAKRNIHMLLSQAHKEEVGLTNWSLADTARFLGISKGHLSEDIQLAESMELVPSLSEHPTKKQAVRALSRVKESLLKKELAKKAEASLQKDKRVADLLQSYRLEDFFLAAEEIEDESFDFAEVDPPYNCVLPLNTLLTMSEEQKETLKTKEFSQSDSEYQEFLFHCFELVYKKLKPNTWILVWSGGQLPASYSVLLQLRKANFVPCQLPFVWTKQPHITKNPATTLWNSYETAIYARKGDAFLQEESQPNTKFFPLTERTRRIHPTEKPIDLLEFLLKIFNPIGGRVLVPFLGSGNTLLAAANLNMSGLGFELLQEYRSSFCLRVGEGLFGRYK